MSELQVNQIAGQGMRFERMRVELATLRLALINMSFSSPAEATHFAAQLGLVAQTAELEQSHAQFKKVMEPDNPIADSDGYVYRFDVNPTHEMATLVSASRAYEANVRAYNTNSQLNKAALEIGNR